MTRHILPNLLFLLLVCVACSSNDETKSTIVADEIASRIVATPTPVSLFEKNFSPKDCNFKLQTDRKFQCGYLDVPADHRNPRGATIQISVAIFYAKNSVASESPLVYLHGGPGSHSLQTIPFTYGSVFSKLNVNRDLVFFDQRGVGSSVPALNCPEVNEEKISSLNTKQSIESEQDSFINALKQCHRRLKQEGVDFSLFNTLASAHDAESLRVALGYEKWDLLAVSYGTRLAQTIMREYPETIGKVVLDSSYPLEQDIYASIPMHADRAFELLFLQCKSSPECNENFPGLEAKLIQAVKQLDEYPMPGNAVMIKTDNKDGNTFAAENIPTLMTGNRLVSVLFQSMYQSELIPWLPEVISSAFSGNVEEANILLSNDLSTMQYTSLGQYYSVQCPDEIGFTNLRTLRQSSLASEFFKTLFDSQDIYAKEHISICEFWGATSSSSIENDPVISSIPTLVLAGKFDPITPPSDGKKVAANLKDSTFIEFPGTSHGVIFSNSCALKIVKDFYSNSNQLSSECVGKASPVKWLQPLKKTSFENYVDPSSKIISIQPIGWVKQAPGFVSRTTLGVVGLAQQIVPMTNSNTLSSNVIRSFGPLATNNSLGTIKTDIFSWEIFDITANGQLTILATTDIGSSAALVLVSGLPSQRNDLIQSIMNPVLNKFKVQVN